MPATASEVQAPGPVMRTGQRGQTVLDSGPRPAPRGLTEGDSGGSWTLSDTVKAPRSQEPPATGHWGCAQGPCRPHLGDQGRVFVLTGAFSPSLMIVGA